MQRAPLVSKATSQSYSSFVALAPDGQVRCLTSTGRQGTTYTRPLSVESRSWQHGTAEADGLSPARHLSFVVRPEDEPAGDSAADARHAPLRQIHCVRDAHDHEARVGSGRPLEQVVQHRLLLGSLRGATHATPVASSTETHRKNHHSVHSALDSEGSSNESHRDAHDSCLNHSSNSSISRTHMRRRDGVSWIRWPKIRFEEEVRLLTSNNMVGRRAYESPRISLQVRSQNGNSFQDWDLIIRSSLRYTTHHSWHQNDQRSGPSPPHPVYCVHHQLERVSSNAAFTIRLGVG